MDEKKLERIYTMKVASVYELLLKKLIKKNRTKEELETVTCWLTGYTVKELYDQLDKDVDYETFFNEAPKINSNASKITGLICGVRVEEIEDPIYLRMRQLDKLVDELAKGKSMEKVLRT